MDVFRCAAGKVAAVLSLIVLLASPATVWAVNAYDILDKNIRSSEMVSPLTSELMGDQVSLYNGATEFKVVDIDLKGNNQLPVQLARRFQIHVHEHGMLTPGGFANTVPEPLNTFGGGWSADVPYIYGAFEASHGWKNGAGHQRCSSMGPPQVSPGVNLSDVWSGYRINIPGEGEMQMLSLTANHTRPADGHIYRWGTSRLHRGRCIPSAIGIAGEGFVFVSSDGITYRFDVAVSRNGGSFYASEINTPIQRTNIYLMASRVEDRHGNYVNYNYVNGALRSIESNDGRRITLNYVGNRIDNAVADAKTWRYGYTSAALTSVTLPDLSAWTYHHIGEPSVMITPIQVIVPDDPLVCGPPHVYSEPYTIEITHPSGATGRFEFLYMGHLISGTPAQAYCYLEYDPISQTHRRSMGIPDFFYNYALTSKTIGGPGLSPKTWTYEYGQPDTGHTNFSGAYCTGCDQEKSVYVKEPDGTMIEHSFSALWGLNNGQLMGKYTRDASNKILRSETHTFVSETEIGSMPFPAIHGDLLGSHDRSSMLNRPIKVTQIAQGGDVAGPPDYTPPQPPPPPPPCQGNDCPPPPPPCERNPVTGVCDDPTVIDDPNANASSVQSASGVPPTIFIRTVTAFDALARPLNEIKSNSLGYSKTDSTTYHDNLSKWVIGQAATQSTNGVQFARTEYDAGAQPHKTYSFGKLQQTLTYHGDGTLATVSDGSDSDNFNSTITLSNWKRGIPQLIQHPATPDQPSGTSQSAAVNDHGEIASITDENGYKTCYGYDVMSRLASITYPDELNIGECDTDDSHWKKTAIEFGGGHAAAYGLPAGHWRQMVSTGNSRKEILFDALWRPVVEQSYDNAHPDATISQVVKRYDVSGRLAFQSYPQRNLQLDYRTVGKGTYTQYDALDRVTKIIQSWEKEAEGFPPLTTTTEYLPGFQTRITNPRNAQTTSGYMAWDQPSYDLPVWIVQSEDAHTHIARDAFGKPTAITRQNGTGSFAVTRHYAYNASQQLCNATEPETGGTLMGYDAAGNLAWSAAGLPANTPCEAEGLSPAILARKVSRTYDARNRLKTLRFPDTRGDQDWSYTADGLPLSITTVNVPGAVHPINQYVYNKRRLPTSETQHMPAWYSYSLGYKYDANGHLERITYPSTDFVDFAPNALGQPTQARNASGHAYAYGVTYHPNGSIAAFTYGNGIVHAMTPNDRQLPKTVRSSGVLEYEYSYDANGNVGAILDKTRDPWGHRYMEYDALDRLTHVGSPTFGELGNGHHMYFTYDALDNLKTWKNPAFDGTMLRDHLYCYNASNQLEQVRSGATTCSNGAMADHFAYDGQGNVDVHDNRGFDFDYGNRLREVMGIERYRYDAHGRRILAMNFGSGTIFSQYGQNGQLLYQKNTRTGQNKQIDHIYLGGSLIAQREQGLTANSPVVVKYQHTDALSSPVAVTDQNRTLIERVDYEPYGKAMNAVTNTGQDRPGYTGHVGDAATQLTYMQQRYYDPSIGRFLSVDPVTANSTTGANFNRYKYAANNPYRFTDPDGRQEREVRDWRSITAKSPGAAAQMATSARSSTSGNSSSSRKSEIKYNAPAPRTVPPSGENAKALKCTANCLGSEELLVTGGAEQSGHSRTSLHYEDKAVDIPGTPFNNLKHKDVMACGKICGYTHGWWEDKGSYLKDHWHLQMGQRGRVPPLPDVLGPSSEPFMPLMDGRRAGP